MPIHSYNDFDKVQNRGNFIDKLSIYERVFFLGTLFLFHLALGEELSVVRKWLKFNCYNFLGCLRQRDGPYNRYSCPVTRN